MLFEILTNESDQVLGNKSIPMLINPEHIVSIKPIRIVCKDEVINGFWLRTSNNKKYRAISAPEQIKKQLGDAHLNSQLIETIDLNNSEFLENSFH